MRQTDRIERVLESQAGRKIDFSSLSKQRAQQMLSRVQGLLREHRASPEFHQSEKNPAYLQLVMMEQGLTAATSAAPGTAPAGVDPQQAYRMQAELRTRRQQIQTAIRQKQQEIAELQKQMNSPTLGVGESKRRRISEGEVQQAQVVMAAQDMVDQMQKVLEQVSAMQYKDLPALSDAIKNDMGTEQSSAFTSSATQALTTLLASVQQAKTELETAQSALTGTEPVVPGETDELPPPDASTEDDLDLSLDANLGDEDLGDLGDEDEEETPPSRALGRERR